MIYEEEISNLIVKYGICYEDLEEIKNRYGVEFIIESSMGELKIHAVFMEVKNINVIEVR